MIVDGEKTCLTDGVVRIIWGDVGKTIYVSSCCYDSAENGITLNKCLELVGYCGLGCVTVIMDDFQSGRVFHFGNYDNENWYEYGLTWGFA